jgi:hypothetical protein
MASLVSILFLVILQQLRPFAHPSDNFLALASSLSLTVLFVCCIVLKVSGWLGLPQPPPLTLPPAAAYTA